MNEIRKQIEESIRTKELLLVDEEMMVMIKKAAELCIGSLREGNKILLAGNGGSAADAQHLAGEMVNRFMFDRPAIAAISLATDTSVLTSISNDYDYKWIFSRQVEAIGKKGDVLVVLSTSGNSENILLAVEAARERGLFTIGLTGSTGGKLAGKCDILIKAPSPSTPRIQEVHIMIGHIICTVIENDLYNQA